MHAIQNGRVAHAYLFTGTRGVGKTSSARLLARALNAPETLPEKPYPPETRADDFPGVEVQQRMADAIMRGDDLNVIEIDGASNRGVNEARDLIAKAGLAPSGQARYKIYIVDEVHMLTTEAFNTLLKTMEEPPPHVKFILCTTEPHKIPQTIHSRCQRFTFRNIPPAVVAEHLKDVLAQENLAADNAALMRVAHMADGSMRDALSLLDRLVATGQQPLTLGILENLLGLPPSEGILQLAAAMGQKDVVLCLSLAEQILSQGIAIEQLLESLLQVLRDLMVLAACGDKTNIQVTVPMPQAYDIAQNMHPAMLSYAITLCEATDAPSEIRACAACFARCRVGAFGTCQWYA